MNKITLSVSLLALILSVFSFFYFQPDSEFAYVDVNVLLDGYKRTDVERTKFNEKAKKLQSNVDSLIGNWQKQLQQYEKERSSMSKKELRLQQELLSNKQQQINSYQQAIDKQIQEEEQNTTQTVINDINDFVTEYGKKNNYDIIFGASGNGNIMYADKGTDLTQIVLQGLNADYKQK